MHTASYRVLQDNSFELKQSQHASERAKEWTFSLTPRIVADQAAVLMFHLDPSSDVDLTLNISLNDTLVRTGNYTSGVGRSIVEVIRGGILKAQNNHLLFEVYAGHHGNLKIRSVVLWFHTELLVPGEEG